MYKFTLFISFINLLDEANFGKKSEIVKFKITEILDILTLNDTVVFMFSLFSNQEKSVQVNEILRLIAS